MQANKVISKDNAWIFIVFFSLITFCWSYLACTSAKTLLYDKSPFYTYNVYLDEVYTIDESRTSILCGNAAWSESTKCCTTEAAIQGITAISEEVLFFYCEDGGRMLFLETGEVVPYESA